MLVVNDPCRRVILGIVAFHKGHRAGGVDPGQAGVVEPTHVEETVAVAHLLQEVAQGEVEGAGATLIEFLVQLFRSSRDP